MASTEPVEPHHQAPATGVPSAEFWLFRFFLVAASVSVCYKLQPFGWNKFLASIAGLSFAAPILLVEWRQQRGTARGVFGGVVGLVSGLLAALLATLVLSRMAVSEPGKTTLIFLSLAACGYLGLAIGASRGAAFFGWPSHLSESSPQAPDEPLKLLDTSVLIDGRIADICEAHFLDGVLGVPQFVLHELQMVADSGDALKRQRGRRGLEILQRMQKMPYLQVRILEDRVPAELPVDDKLVELARRTTAKIITNDFNLNKVATLHGIAVLNVNLLANAMKPAVLPGEPMRVLILREGKEPNQGVAYLDDGTMVVVDGGRRMINKSVDVVVTSVHQTTAGKMIFGRLDEAPEPALAAKQAAAGAGGAHNESSPGVSETAPNGGRPGNKTPEGSHS